MPERESNIWRNPPERRHTKTTVIVDFVGSSAFAANAFDRLANGQIVSGILSAFASTCFFAKPIISELSYKRKLKRYNSST